MNRKNFLIIPLFLFNFAYVASEALVDPIVYDRVRYGHKDIFEKITKETINVPDNQGRTFLHHACMSRAFSSLEEYDRNNNEALSRIDVVRFLVKHGADVNSRDNLGNIPLHYAASLFDTLLLELIQAGSAINSRNIYGKIPLHFAIEQKNLSAVKVLTQSGSDLHMQTDKDLDALGVAYKALKKTCKTVLRNKKAEKTADARTADLLEKLEKFNKKNVEAAIKIVNYLLEYKEGEPVQPSFFTKLSNYLFGENSNKA